MSGPPISAEVGAALARFFFGGAGPSHSRLTTAFASAGYGDEDPYDATLGTPNKETRVHVVVGAAVRRPARARELVDAILVPLRVAGHFDAERSTHDPERVRALQRALNGLGWSLTDDGNLTPLGVIDLTIGGRAALDEQLARLRRSSDDPGAMLGSAKDLLEAVAKFVLEEFNVPAPKHDNFDHLWYLARDRLGLLPQNVDTAVPGGECVRAILQSAWRLAEQVNVLRGIQGAGHGRTLPTGVSNEMALLVVREAFGIAELTLTTLDSQLGR